VSEEAWREVAETRLRLIEELKREKGTLAAEVEFLKRAPDVEKVTRVVVVKNSGITSETFAGHWRAFLQDEGRTLKLFGTGSGHEALQERDEALGRDLVDILRTAGCLKKERRLYCNGCGAAFVGGHDCKRVPR
jgi:hypothetical protein